MCVLRKTADGASDIAVGTSGQACGIHIAIVAYGIGSASIGIHPAQGYLIKLDIYRLDILCRQASVTIGVVNQYVINKAIGRKVPSESQTGSLIRNGREVQHDIRATGAWFRKAYNACQRASGGRIILYGSERVVIITGNITYRQCTSVRRKGTQPETQLQLVQWGNYFWQ